MRNWGNAESEGATRVSKVKIKVKQAMLMSRDAQQRAGVNGDTQVATRERKRRRKWDVRFQQAEAERRKWEGVAKLSFRGSRWAAPAGSLFLVRWPCAVHPGASRSLSVPPEAWALEPTN